MGIGLSADQSEVVNKVFISAKKTVGTSQVLAAVSTSNNEDRQELVIYNTSTSTIYVGPSGVTVSGSNEGIPIDPKEAYTQTLGPDLDLYMICATSADVIIWELG